MTIFLKVIVIVLPFLWVFFLPARSMTTLCVCTCINSGFCWTRLHSRRPQTNLTLYSGHVCLLKAQNDSQICSVIVFVPRYFYFWSLHCCNISILLAFVLSFYFFAAAVNSGDCNLNTESHRVVHLFRSGIRIILFD